MTFGVLVLTVLPADAVFAGLQPFHLRGGGPPTAVMSTSSPPDMPLPNYDPGRDTAPGLVLARSSLGQNETDPAKYQRWALDASGKTLSVNGLRIWAAAKDFDRTAEITLGAYLMDCGDTCELLDTATATLQGTADWRLVTLPLELGSTDFAENRALVVKITALESSETDMWLAYGTATYDAYLQVNVIAAAPATTIPPSTTTPTTTATTSSTSAPTGSSVDTTTARQTPSTVTITTSTTRPATDMAPGGDGEDGGSDRPAPSPTDASGVRPPGGADAIQPMVFDRADPDTNGAKVEEVDIFRTTRELEPAEGLSVAFATVAENITLYWQAAVGTGGVASILIWIGLSRRKESEELDAELELFD